MAEASGGESSSFAGPSTSDVKGDDVANSESQKEKPTCILCLGMAGSGKTTFVQVHYLVDRMCMHHNLLKTSLISLVEALKKSTERDDSPDPGSICNGVPGGRINTPSCFMVLF